MVKDVTTNTIAKARQVAANETFERSGISGARTTRQPQHRRGNRIERLHHEGERKQRRKKKWPIACRPPGDDDAHEHGRARRNRAAARKCRTKARGSCWRRSTRRQAMPRAPSQAAAQSRNAPPHRKIRSSEPQPPRREFSDRGRCDRRGKRRRHKRAVRARTSARKLARTRSSAKWDRAAAADRSRRKCPRRRPGQSARFPAEYRNRRRALCRTDLCRPFLPLQ